MLQLIMDTSNQYLMVALYEDDQCLSSLQEMGSKRQSENAIPYLQKLLEKHQKELLDIDEMVITLGPGSYTGERVALTIAKTLSVISSVHIKAISSLAAYAGLQKCVSVIDARSQKVFVCAYENGQAVIPEQMIDIQQFPQFMQDYSDFQVVGQNEVVGYEPNTVDLAKNLHELAKQTSIVQNVDALVPRYLEEIETLVQLEHTLMTSPWSKEDFEYELLENPFAHIFVLKKEMEIIGYVDLWVMYEQAQIASIGIKKEEQSQGYGQKLLEFALSYARDAGVNTMSLEVRKSNQKAIALYQKNGFDIQSIRRDYYQDNHEDAYLMTKEMEGKA